MRPLRPPSAFPCFLSRCMATVPGEGMEGKPTEEEEVLQARAHTQEAPGLSFLGERGPVSFSSSGQSGLSSGGPIPGPREVLGESGGGTILGERRATRRGAAGEVRGGGPPLGRVQTQMHRQPGARGVWRLCPGRGPEPCLAGPPAGRMACGLPPCPAGSAEASVASSPRGCPSLITRNERLFVHERKATCMCL